MKQLGLKEIKEIELALLDRFSDCCKKNNITYFLSNGTLLGAIKYKGFIPWDDDIDVLVPRADYDRLMSSFKDTDVYKLFSYERNPNYRFPFAKLCDMTTRKEELNINNGVDLGIDIDIFPLDFWDDDFERAKTEAKHINRNMFYLNLTKLYRPESINPIKRFVKWVIVCFYKICGSRHFVQRVIKESNKAGQRGSSYLGCKSWCIYGEREIIPAEVFSETVEVEFEGALLPAPVGYDIYLRSLYGDYEKDPPAEAQKSHHKYKAYRV